MLSMRLSRQAFRLHCGVREGRSSSCAIICRRRHNQATTFSSAPTNMDATHSTTNTEGNKHRNRLATEASPYLLQHAHNPVDWLPWGPEALEKARREDKPIFLSVGYSTCHWCHVMERESFESEEVAALMNKNFVNIKVDREERPDVDRIYMAFVQGTTGSGGWPMSVFLSPELEPLYGGTYYPPKDIIVRGHLARPGFTTVLRRIAELWATQKDALREQGASIMSQLREGLVSSAAAGAVGESVKPDLAQHAIQTCVKHLWHRFDKELGGFGGAPKFPRPSEINVLLRAHVMQQEAGTDAEEARNTQHMALMSLRAMAAGGVHALSCHVVTHITDQVGGGFARYSVDEFWHVPHFEKMLYDQTQLAVAYTNAFQMTGDPQYAKVARDILDYLRRDMTAPGGGIYSAEDADSLDTSTGKKLEGAFYLWTATEIRQVLGEEHATVFGQAYFVKEEGNCTLSERSDPHGEFVGKNCLIQRRPLADVAASAGLPLPQLEALLAECRRKLHSARAKRPRPGLDNKVVAAWNGLAISAFSLASRALAAESPPCPALFPVDGVPPQTYLEAALRTARFVRQELYDETSGTLRRTYCNGPSAVQGFADDYAYLIGGLLDLYECGGGMEWLQWALQLQATMDRLFWDEDGGGYFSTSGEDKSIILRMKDDYDGAEPTASSSAACNLFRLAALVPGGGRGGGSAGGGATGAGSRYQQYAERTLAAFQERLFEAPLAVPQMCCAAFLQLKAPLRQVIVAGRAGMEDTQRLLDAVHAGFVPDKVVLVIDPQDQAAMELWARHSPEAHAMVEHHFGRTSRGQGAAASAPDAAATVFVCQNFTCQAPTSNPGRVWELLTPTAGAAGPRLTPMTGLKL